MFLVDTNVWLELLLEQEKAGEVRRFLQMTSSSCSSLNDASDWTSMPTSMWLQRSTTWLL
jgi:predicted nucleic acid-binding protein